MVFFVGRHKSTEVPVGADPEMAWWVYAPASTHTHTHTLDITTFCSDNQNSNLTSVVLGALRHSKNEVDGFMF